MSECIHAARMIMVDVVWMLHLEGKFSMICAALTTSWPRVSSFDVLGIDFTLHHLSYLHSRN